MSSERKKPGTKPRQIDDSIVQSIVGLYQKGVPMKYVAIITEESPYFVKKVLQEQNLYQYRPRQVSSTGNKDNTADSPQDLDPHSIDL